MQVFPLMDIRFPEAQESALIEAMESRAQPPWQWQAHDAFGKAPVDGSFYFHRDGSTDEPPCTLCIRREGQGHLVVHTIVPDENTVHNIKLDQYVDILNEFDARIAGPATEGLQGMTSIGTSSHTLEDHFSPQAVKLLECFCLTSNAGDGGSNPSEQEKWMDFLLHVYRNNENVHCDRFRACLKAKNWWPEEGIPELVHEYDFAMRLLKQANES